MAPARCVDLRTQHRGPRPRAAMCHTPAITFCIQVADGPIRASGHRAQPFHPAGHTYSFDVVVDGPDLALPHPDDPSQDEPGEDREGGGKPPPTGGRRRNEGERGSEVVMDSRGGPPKRSRSATAPAPDGEADKEEAGSD